MPPLTCCTASSIRAFAMSEPTRAGGSRPWRRARRHVTFAIGLAITVMLVLTAALSLTYTPRDPLEMSMDGRLQGPSRAHPGAARPRVRAGGPCARRAGRHPGRPAYLPQYDASAHRPGDHQLPGGHPGRGRAVLSRPGHPATASVVGPDAPGGPSLFKHVSLVCHLSGHRNRLDCARLKSARRWPEGSPRPKTGGIAKTGRRRALTTGDKKDTATSR